MPKSISKTDASEPGAKAKTKGPDTRALSLSFRAKLLVLIFLIVIPALGLTLYGNFNERQVEKLRVLEGASALCDLAAAHEKNLIENTRQLLTTLTRFPFLLLSTNRSFSEGNLANLRKLSPDYANFGLIETNGMLFCAAEPSTGVISLADRLYFREVLRTGRFSIGDFLVERLTGKAALNLGFPVTNQEGHVERVLFASLKISRLSTALKDIRVPSGGAVTVLDRRGTIVARKPDSKKWVGKQFPDQRAANRVFVGDGKDFEMKGSDKISRQYAVALITEANTPCLFVVVEAPLTVLFASADEVLVRSFIVLVVAAFTIWLVVGLYAKRQLIMPIRVLAEAAKRLAAGDLTARAGSIRGSSELLQLGSALDEMAANVQERTSSLLRTNEALSAEIEERKRAEQRVKEQEEEKKKLEEQFLRSQRMESLGALASGVAHDLNNALVPVLMGAEMLREGEDNKEVQGRLIDLITSSGQRCQEMVKQIVSFARGTRGKTGHVPVHQLMKEMAKIAKETFPKNITTVVREQAGLWGVEGDPTEFHQVLLNLCVNARDAMPKGGTLTLSAANFTLEDESSSNRKPGSYLRLSVSDTGTGIPSDLRARVFEPFFTTKEADKGTGLGLSTVATIVKKNQGFMELESEMGKGTEFKIYLPAHVPVDTDPTETKDKVLPSGHGELILFADDEQVVLGLAKAALENYGYRVLTAKNGLEAVASFERHMNEVALVITDNDMPFLDGVSAVSAMQRLVPNIRVIFASATKQDTTHLSLSELGRIETLTKPYGIDQLIRGVAHILSPQVHQAEVIAITNP